MKFQVLCLMAILQLNPGEPGAPLVFSYDCAERRPSGVNGGIFYRLDELSVSRSAMIQH